MRVFCAFLLSFAIAAPASAHERRPVATYELVVGWGEEPAYSGVRNSVQLTLSSGGAPVTDLGDSLKVEVMFGAQKMAPVALEPQNGKPGEYRLWFVPTRPGAYTFHFFGAIRGQGIDQLFTSSETTFDPVISSSDLAFPVKDPTNEELAARIERLGPRIGSVRSAADAARRTAGIATNVSVATLAILVLFGAIALGIWRRRA